MDSREFALNILQRSPAVSNNPQAKVMIDILRSGDNARGEELADNLCKTYGLTREEAITKARTFFGI